ncbi:hypothetical protein IMSHALPRED_010124 [Imshaugia aleurites]|uniref:Uncharacterized protein n=1 Tax=Imshaugia aleurites TaxID=172621 RepID=A0A8H3G5V3_9LECA|nr:hypothetical protein IMSHALPRED_010124 [Imshaugia aleurites]
MSSTPLKPEIACVIKAEENSSLGFYGEEGACAQAHEILCMAWAAGTMKPIRSECAELKARWRTGLVAGCARSRDAAQSLMWIRGSLNPPGPWRKDRHRGLGVSKRKQRFVSQG